jgi:predicted nucleic acid-binding protein
VIVADTSGLYAIFNRRQPEHQAARAAVERDGGPLWLSPQVLAELDYFVLTRLGTAKSKATALAWSRLVLIVSVTSRLLGS